LFGAGLRKAASVFAFPDGLQPMTVLSVGNAGNGFFSSSLFQKLN
jgi:hypothetical protein